VACYNSGHWENCINSIVILNNSHQFKDNPEYGKRLKRMWTGELSKKDREIINTRVIGKNGLELPNAYDGDVYYTCPTNMESNAISAASFENHVMETHPYVNNQLMPPDHAIISTATPSSTK